MRFRWLPAGGGGNRRRDLEGAREQPRVIGGDAGRLRERQAIGAHFTARAETMRLGSRVASTRMEFHGAQGELLATGAGAYIVS